MFSVQFVFLVCLNRIKKMTDFYKTWWKGVAWAKEKPILERGGMAPQVSFWLTLRDAAFGLGRSLHSPSVLLVVVVFFLVTDCCWRPQREIVVFSVTS